MTNAETAQDLDAVRVQVSQHGAADCQHERADEGLRASEDLYRHLFENLSDATFVADAETGQILEINSQGESLLGRKREEIVGMDQVELYPPELRGECRKRFAEHLDLAQGHTADYEAQVIRADGTTVPVAIKATTFTTNARRFVIGLFRDVTERRRSLEQLREVLAQNESLIESVSSILIAVDALGVVSLWNTQAENALGISSAHAVGKPFISCGIPAESSFVRTVWESFSYSIAKEREEIEYKHPDGKLVLLGMTINPVKVARGEQGGLVILARDITEIKAMEEELSRSQKLDAIGRLAAGIAHEINTPTQFIGDNIRFLDDSFSGLLRLTEIHRQLATAIRSGVGAEELLRNAEALSREVDIDYFSQEIPKAIRQTLDGVDRVSKIVGAMREFSHPGPAEKTPTDINSAIENTIIVCRNEWKYVAEMTTDLDPALPPVVCIRGALNEVVLNLIVNAAHAIADAIGDRPERKGRIAISTCCDGRWVEIRIADTGSGIPPEIRSKLFDPFFTTKEIGKGTGQGLAIAHSVIVDKHGGSITFETEIGKGTTFIVRLPVT